MGQERATRVTFGNQVSSGKVLLETSELLFRGDFRLRIPFRDISALASDSDFLDVTWPGGRAVFELGKDAPIWAHKIRNPRGLLEKLGVRSLQTISILGVADEIFLQQLRDLPARSVVGHAAPDSDLVFYGADDAGDLAGLARLRAAISDRAAIWVVSPKGARAHIRDVDVMAAAREAGLVDTKVVSFSDTHTALKLVVPVAQRSKR